MARCRAPACRLTGIAEAVAHKLELERRVAVLHKQLRARQMGGVHRLHGRRRGDHAFIDRRGTKAESREAHIAGDAPILVVLWRDSVGNVVIVHWYTKSTFTAYYAFIHTKG